MSQRPCQPLHGPLPEIGIICQHLCQMQCIKVHLTFSSELHRCAAAAGSLQRQSCKSQQRQYQPLSIFQVEVEVTLKHCHPLHDLLPESWSHLPTPRPGATQSNVTAAMDISAYVSTHEERKGLDPAHGFGMSCKDVNHVQCIQVHLTIPNQ